MPKDKRWRKKALWPKTPPITGSGLPLFFKCPSCGTSTMSLRVDETKRQVMLFCNYCKTAGNISIRAGVFGAVDYYNEFFDLYTKRKSTTNSAPRDLVSEEKEVELLDRACNFYSRRLYCRIQTGAGGR